MWSWLWPILGFLGKWIGKALSRFWSVFLVAFIIISIFLWVNGGIAKIKAAECKACISEYTQTHPTYGSVGTVNNNTVKTAGIEVASFGFGFWHRR
jgi:hypothetical protein